MVDSWTCEVQAHRHSADGQDCRIIAMLPSINWGFVSVPNDPMNFDITYTDQFVPPSTRQQVPANLTNENIQIRKAQI